MVTATRKQFIELEDGSVQFSVVVAPEDVDALISLAPLPGCRISLMRPEAAAMLVAQSADREFAASHAPTAPPGSHWAPKPPTQTVAPVGENHAAFGPSSAREARQAIELCNNPWFQQFARANRPDSKNPDDLEVAKGFMVSTVAPGGKWTTESVTLLQGVMRDYKTWCHGRGYTNG